jgi:hypothetical protein
MKTISCSEAGFEYDCIVKCRAEEEDIKNGIVHVVKDHRTKATTNER